MHPREATTEALLADPAESHIRQDVAWFAVALADFVVAHVAAQLALWTAEGDLGDTNWLRSTALQDAREGVQCAVLYATDMADVPSHVKACWPQWDAPEDFMPTGNFDYLVDELRRNAMVDYARLLAGTHLRLQAAALSSCPQHDVDWSWLRRQHTRVLDDLGLDAVGLDEDEIDEIVGRCIEFATAGTLQVEREETRRDLEVHGLEHEFGKWGIDVLAFRYSILGPAPDPGEWERSLTIELRATNPAVRLLNLTWRFDFRDSDGTFIGYEDLNISGDEWSVEEHPRVTIRRAPPGWWGVEVDTDTEVHEAEVRALKQPLGHDPYRSWDDAPVRDLPIGLETLMSLHDAGVRHIDDLAELVADRARASEVLGESIAQMLRDLAAIHGLTIAE